MNRGAAAVRTRAIRGKSKVHFQSSLQFVESLKHESRLKTPNLTSGIHGISLGKTGPIIAPDALATAVPTVLVLPLNPLVAEGRPRQL